MIVAMMIMMIFIMLFNMSMVGHLNAIQKLLNAMAEAKVAEMKMFETFKENR